MDIKRKEKELGSFIGKILRDHFGKGPGAVFATISPPYITVYIKNFLSPMENKLLNTEQSKYVEKIRDMLMPALIEEIKAYVKINVEFDIIEFYYDWNLDSHSGMFVGIASHNHQERASYQNQEEVHNEIIKLSMEAEKPPGEVYSCLVNPRTLVIVRHKILVPVEKEMIQLGYPEILTLVKRNLERRLALQHKHQLQSYLDAELENTFVSWDFDLDKSVFLFILKPNSRRQQ
ncbi:Na-translocating system protein MpsC family protein [Domibacillus indicus]|uniref:Na-translocating system protein MpsC family protein n=1 Tax=Domibacillus indicus TaxID=1437523 RepID=UPI00061811D2|nr:Na-translocating system protein MpsC family protein [Domibacillus indicus]